LEVWTLEEVKKWFEENEQEEFRSLAIKFPVGGKGLATLSKEDFQAAVGPVLGSALYNAVQDLKKPPGPIGIYCTEFG
jgi:hypothetical protein